MSEPDLGYEPPIGNNDTITNQVDIAFMLTDVADSLYRDLTIADVGKIHFVEHMQTELDTMLKKNNHIGKSLDRLHLPDYGQSSSFFVKSTVAQVSSEIEQLKKLLYEATLSSITKSTSSQKCRTRLEISTYSLSLSIHGLHNRLKQLEQGGTSYNCRIY